MNPQTNPQNPTRQRRDALRKWKEEREDSLKLPASFSLLLVLLLVVGDLLLKERAVGDLLVSFVVSSLPGGKEPAESGMVLCIRLVRERSKRGT